MRQTIAVHSSFRQGAYLGMTDVTLQTPHQMDFCRVMLPTANIYAGIQGYALETRMNIRGCFQQIG